MINASKYAGMKICVAVSGGKDSMALLHFLFTHAKEYGITLSALNCDHKIRGVSSARDSAFVKEWCLLNAIPLAFFEWNTDEAKTELSARLWRLQCYKKAIENGADAVATAHHLNDNAETILFNLARGSALSGLEGITDGNNLIRPMIACTREEIDDYIKENNIPYVEDETNFTDGYTRNKIRHNVLPELERAVPNATKAIYRFSRLAAEDEGYFESLIKERGLINQTPLGCEINFCEEKVIFRRAAVKVIKEVFNRKDYTFEQAERLYGLQFCENGKKFGFLNLTAYKESGKIVITEDNENLSEEIAFYEYSLNNFYGRQFEILKNPPAGECAATAKILKFDLNKIPGTAVIRFARQGDKFTKFGGGTKSLGDYFTDKKIPLRLRKQIPLIADGNEILAVGGVEISDKIKITENTEKICYLVCADCTAKT